MECEEKCSCPLFHGSFDIPPPLHSPRPHSFPKEFTLERHPSHGIINTDFPRLDPTIFKRLAQHDTAKVADSMAGHGVAHHEIKPLRHEMRVCGPALTVLTRPGDALYVQACIDLIQPGDVVVIDAAGYRDVA